MKRQLLLILMLLGSGVVFGQSVLFLHHSTGGNVYNEGNVSQYINDYNEQNSTNIEFIERAYPDSPYPWENNVYDYWNLWINMVCDNASSGTECLESLTALNNIIIFKHCFPGAGILVDDGDGDVSSSEKTLANYKLQYRALREKMDGFQDNKFVVWTLTPLHQLSTNVEQAARAGEFVAWVKNEWLHEDSMEHPNIHIFDFFGIIAEQDETPEHGFQYSLKYQYESSHENGDSHPNTLANETVGPLFAQFIIDLATGSTVNIEPSQEFTEKITVFPNPTNGPVILSGNLPEEADAILYNMLGEKIKIIKIRANRFDIGELQNGIYLLKLDKTAIMIIKE